MRDEYVVRLATSDDIHHLPSIERRAARRFEGWFAETGLTHAILDDVRPIDELENAQRCGHLWVAATAGAELVGFAQVVVLGDVAHLDEMDVVPEHGRKGVGSRLVASVCRWARDAGYSRVTLSTFRDVPWNRAFYEKCGFRVIDVQHLLPGHAALVSAERDRGLRTDLRVIMECPLAG